MRHVRAARRATIAAAVLGAGALLLQYAPPASAHTKPTTAPVFTSKATAAAKVNVAFDFTIKTKGNPVATITESSTLPFGVHFADNANGTATLSGTEPLGGSYTIDLQAANGIGTAHQTLTLAVKSKLPLIRHVFVIMLENDGYASTFGSPTADPYLATTLPSEGALLENYYGVGHFSNDNYDAFISGQPPNSDSQLDCSTYVNFGAGEGQDTQGIQQGAGCVYPAAVKTVADQLNGEGLTWKGYMEDMGNDPSREAANCGHPSIGASDPSFSAVSGDGYATRHDPFVYFHSIIDNTAQCNQDVVPLGDTSGNLPSTAQPGTTGLVTDLQSIATTPNLSFITPNLCDDGHDYPCTNQTGTGGSSEGDINAWLRTWVPIITSSPAFQKDGLLEITFDEGETPTLDTTACCGETPGPAANAGGNGISGPGGGKVGAVLLSPFITPGVKVKTAFNHYSSLASIEDLFGLPRLAEAKTVTSTFDKGVYAK
jgi:phosphatidylinositol-3-phosphatase